MFFLLSKVLWALTAPSNLLIVFVLVTAYLAASRLKRLGRTAIAVAVVLLLVVSYLPVGILLLRPLEDRFPRADLHGVQPAGIIVLGGPLDPTVGAARGMVHLLDGAERLTTGVALSRAYPGVPLIFTGGSANLMIAETSEAGEARKLWLDLGVPADRIVIEDRSRNTYENAQNLRAQLRPTSANRWILVTSAFHMPRAVGLFRKAGFHVLPYPVDYRTTDRATDYTPLGTASQGLGQLEFAMHEWVGLLAYYLSGKIGSPFPGPDRSSAAASGSASRERRASEMNWRAQTT